MVRIERTKTPPESLAREAKKVHGSYEGKDVVQQLKQDFHNKCYICELGNLTDPQVEHLLPHYNRKRKERVFDWDNLFYVCPHCNSIKNNRKYDEKILDCCKEDPEDVLEHILEEGHVRVQAHMPEEKRENVEMTADLIQNCFEKCNQGIREAGCQERLRRLSNTMNMLYKTLGKLEEGKASGIDRKALRNILSREHEFAGFTRYYVRIHLERFPELKTFVSEK